ncbi:MAG: gephyrin-like molybdotransferase Glp [Polyangiaceae bacterium]
MLTLAEAQDLIRQGIRAPVIERVALDQAVGRVLAEPVVAAEPYPVFNASSMDGYAVSSVMVRTANVRLPVVGESRAGSRPSKLAPGTAMRIFTGAPLPEGADAVIMQEDVIREGGHALFGKKATQWQFVRGRGEDLGEGATALAAGVRLGASQIALCALLDRVWLPVTRRPHVAIVPTGSELRAAGEAGIPGMIPEANGVAVAAMARNVGATTTLFPPAPDIQEALDSTFAEALRGADLIVTIGGVSVGDHDMVRPTLEKLGVRTTFHKIALKPGKPLLFGQLGDRHVLGLPGNPVSALVTFAFFGAPLLRLMQGETHAFPTPARAALGKTMRHAKGRLELVRASVHLDPRDGAWVATPLPNQASGAVSTLATADALIALPADQETFTQGTPVDVYSCKDLGLAT